MVNRDILKGGLFGRRMVGVWLVFLGFRKYICVVDAFLYMLKVAESIGYWSNELQAFVWKKIMYDKQERQYSIFYIGLRLEYLWWAITVYN